MMNRLIGIIVFLGIVVFFAFPVFAEGKEGTAVAKKETLVAFWEEQVRNSSETKLFEKTQEAGVYNFETSFFPYKGRLKLLNAVVSQTNGTYHIDTAGIIEVELLDATPDFYKKYARSYRAWSESGYYYYYQKQDKWFLPSEWSEHETDWGSDRSSEWMLFLVSVAPFLIFLALFGSLFFYARRQSRRARDRNDEILVNQNMAIQKMDESMQKMDEQTMLLQQIADSMAKKQK